MCGLLEIEADFFFKGNIEIFNFLFKVKYSLKTYTIIQRGYDQLGQHMLRGMEGWRNLRRLTPLNPRAHRALDHDCRLEFT